MTTTSPPAPVERAVDLDEHERIDRAMTPGPWKADLDVFNMEDEGIVACITDEPISFVAQIPTDLTMRKSEWTREAADAQWKVAEEGQALRDAKGIVYMRNTWAARTAELRAARERIAAQDDALAKISAIRDSIIGAQKVNWSEHIYPLVAALDAAGYKGVGYEVARENLGTLIDAVKKGESRIAALEQRERELLAIVTAIANTDVDDCLTGLKIYDRTGAAQYVVDAARAVVNGEPLDVDLSPTGAAP